MKRILLQIDRQCIENLKRTGGELIVQPDGTEIDIRWSETPLVKQENQSGEGCFASVEDLRR